MNLLYVKDLIQRISKELENDNITRIQIGYLYEDYNNNKLNTVRDCGYFVDVVDFKFNKEIKTKNEDGELVSRDTLTIVGKYQKDIFTDVNNRFYLNKNI